MYFSDQTMQNSDLSSPVTSTLRPTGSASMARKSDTPAGERI
jgi:hypothetical protein